MPNEIDINHLKNAVSLKSPQLLPLANPIPKTSRIQNEEIPINGSAYLGDKYSYLWVTDYEKRKNIKSPYFILEISFTEIILKEVNPEGEKKYQFKFSEQNLQGNGVDIAHKKEWFFKKVQTVGEKLSKGQLNAYVKGRE